MQTEKVGQADSVVALSQSFKRSLLATNKAPRTIESYLEAVGLLGAFLAETGMPTRVGKITREHVESFIADSLERFKPATAAKKYRSVQQFFKRLTVRVSGNFATYTKCRNPSFCNTFRYDIEANETTKIPNPRRKILAAASVAPDGTIYFAAGDGSIFRCEGRTSLWRFTPEDEKFRIASLGPVSVSITSPRTNQGGSTTIFFDAWRRRSRTSDIFKVITLP